MLKTAVISSTIENICDSGPSFSIISSLSLLSIYCYLYLCYSIIELFILPYTHACYDINQSDIIQGTYSLLVIDLW